MCPGWVQGSVDGLFLLLGRNCLLNMEQEVCTCVCVCASSVDIKLAMCLFSFQLRIRASVGSRDCA